MLGHPSMCPVAGGPRGQGPRRRARHANRRSLMRQTHTNILYAIQTSCVTVKLRVRTKNGRTIAAASSHHQEKTRECETSDDRTGLGDDPVPARNGPDPSRMRQDRPSRDATPANGAGRDPAPTDGAGRSPTPADGAGRGRTPADGAGRGRTSANGAGRAGRPQMAQAEAGRPQLAQAEARGAPQQVAGIAAPCK